MHDNETIRQQQVIGDLGVNLIYSCLHYYENPYDILSSILDNISPGSVEVDMFHIEGTNFQNIDNRLMSLRLVKDGMTKAAMFGPDKRVIQPNSDIYGKNIMILRGRFRPVTHVNMDMLKAGLYLFEKNINDEEKVLPIMELTLNDLKLGKEDIDEKDFLDRADILCNLGQHVMISNYHEYYKLIDYLSDITNKKIAIVLGYHNLARILDEKYYQDLKGGVLEAFGKLFIKKAKLYVYPYQGSNAKNLLTSKEVPISSSLKMLFSYLIQNNKIEDLQNIKRENLHIISDNVLLMIKNNMTGWERFVPDEVSSSIKEKKLFNYSS